MKKEANLRVNVKHFLTYNWGIIFEIESLEREYEQPQKQAKEVIEKMNFTKQSMKRPATDA